jgi:hypothetical protein
MKLFKAIGAWFRAKYIGIVEYVTLSLLAITGRYVRKLIILKGKDPDYVAPPAPPPAPPKVYPEYNPLEAQQKLATYYTSKKPSWTTSSQDSWVKQPSKHPVLAARKQFEEHLIAKAAVVATTSVVSEPQPPSLTPEEAKEILQPLNDPGFASKEWLEVVQSAAGEGEVK